MIEKLPPICRLGQTMLEKKLLLYFERRKSLPFEWRVKHSTGYDPTTIPALMGDWEFVPIFEIGQSVSLFQYKQDREKAIEHFETYKPMEVKRRARREKRKARGPRVRRRK